MIKDKLAHSLTPQIVFDFLSRLLKDANHIILLAELILFSIILGSLPHLWFIGCLVSVGLAWVLSKPKGALHMVYVLSFGWGLIAMMIAYFLSGWGWGAAWGIITLTSSLGIHFRDLKQPLYNPIISEDKNNFKLEQNWPWYRQNLN